jgi:tRNA-2-methylthio-N6-dimethylallyladenosine synthase
MSNNLIKDIDFIDNQDVKLQENTHVTPNSYNTNGKKLYIESYGCAMNFSDSEIVASILAKEGYGTTSTAENADIIFLNTCSIREKAEDTIRKRLTYINNTIKRSKPEMKVGILGCMAERVKEKLLEEEKIVDLVIGPDAYRSLPELIKETEDGRKAVNVILSKEETYGDIAPVRLNSNGVSAFISITRGCDNMCSFCVVPFTRGRERSRSPQSILAEAKELSEKGYKEITLLGQNVDSYLWYGGGPKKEFKNLTKEEQENSTNFAQLLEKVALVDPNIRIRFSTSHPKDITDEVLHTIKKHNNICKYIHLPAQSGNSRILKLMNRTYDREWYLGKVARIREILGEDCGISTDMIAGFCSETEEEHQDSVSLMRDVKYDLAYMFYYSERPGTLAEKKYEDDIPLDVKKRRLDEIMQVQAENSLHRNQRMVGKIHRVLIEGYSKKSDNDLKGRNDQNQIVVFPKENYKIGQYVDIFVDSCTKATLLGKGISK